jgi:hypothetical protein
LVVALPHGSSVPEAFGDVLLVEHRARRNTAFG